jgi:hypothetical protein
MLLVQAFSCQTNTREGYPVTHQDDFTPQLIVDSISEQISLEELPDPIKQGINNDELFNGLNISNIVRIKEKNLTYYDMTFKDIDGLLIMVYYDEKGRIIVP